MLRKEHKTPSGRSKAREKRSDADSPQAGLSPYHSHGDLADLGQQGRGESDEMIEHLLHKTAAKRLAAAEALLSFFQHLNISASMLENLENIMLYCTRAIVPTSKAGEAEKVTAVRLGAALLVCCGDDNLTLQRDFLEAVFTATAAGKLRNELSVEYAAVLALVYAMDDQVMVNSEPLSKGLAQLLGLIDVDMANPSALGALLRCVAYCGDYRDALEHVARGLESANYDVVIAAVEGVGIANERFPGSFAPEAVEPLLRTTTKEAGRMSKKELLPLVRIVLASMTEKQAPQEVVVMQHQREAVVSGFARCYLLDVLRGFVTDGTQRHLARNPTVRRILHVTEDFGRPREQHEFVGHHETLLEKVDRRKERLRDRDLKQQSLMLDE